MPWPSTPPEAPTNHHHPPTKSLGGLFLPTTTLPNNTPPPSPRGVTPKTSQHRSLPKHVPIACVKPRVSWRKTPLCGCWLGFMKPGTKPKPTHLKMLDGNPGKRRLTSGEPVPPAGVVKPPGLDPVA